MSLLDYDGAARALGVSVSTLERLVRADKIPHLRIESLVRFCPDALSQWVADRMHGGSK